MISYEEFKQKQLKQDQELSLEYLSSILKSYKEDRNIGELMIGLKSLTEAQKKT